MPYPIRTHRIDHTHHFEYMLSNSLLYQRPLNPSRLIRMYRGELIPTADRNWCLFDNIGVPYKDDFKPILEENEHIVEFSVASETIVAVSNYDRIYLYKPTDTKRPLSWLSKLGQPKLIATNKLYLPHDRRSWAFSVSVGDTLDKRTDYIHPLDKNAYYEDGNSSPHEFGFTATIYVLLNNGQQIMYWDTGLPPSFSRGFLSPLSGTTQGQMISAAGSTIFISVIDETGQLRYFSRMFDYEIFGGCPGFTFSYTSDTAKAKIVRDRIPLGKGIRKLPLQGWIEHDTRMCTNYRLSHIISIEMRGSGNANRELRILATDLTNQVGYLRKNIFDIEWVFCPEPALDLKYLNQPTFSFDHTRRNILKNYNGLVLKASSNPEHISISLEKFHPFLSSAEPAKLVLQVEDEKIEINFHLVDGWNIINIHSNDHELIGSSSNYLKILRGTLVFTDQSTGGLRENSQLSKFVNKVLKPYNGKTNAFLLQADSSKIFLESDDKKIKLFFYREINHRDVLESFYFKIANTPELTRRPTSPEDLHLLIGMNKDKLTEIHKLHHTFKRRSIKFISILLITEAATRVISPVTHIMSGILGERGKLPIGTMGKRAMHDIKSLFMTQRKVCWKILNSRDPFYEEAISILEKRIDHLENLHRKIKTTVNFKYVS